MSKDVARLHDWSARLVRLAALQAPPALRARLTEEWLADLAERSGALARLRFALGCHWASRVIAVEQPGLQLAPAAPARLEWGATPHGTRRTASVLLVIALHALVFYACWVSLARTHPAMHAGDIEYTPVPTPREHPFQPRGSVDLNPVVVRTPTPPVKTLIEPDSAAAPAVDTAPTLDGGAEGAPLAPQPTVQRVTGGPAPGFPAVDDFYPAAAIRAGESGSTTVQVCVNARGTLTAVPVTVHSSGSATLDAAALKLAAAGSGHYRATTQNGIALPSCFAYAVRFQIKNVR